MPKPKVEKLDRQWNFDYGDIEVAVSFDQAKTEAEARKIADQNYQESKESLDKIREERGY